MILKCFENYIILLLTVWNKTVCRYHCNKSLRIYITNHLNITLNYTIRVSNCCKHRFHMILYIEMFSINLLKSHDCSSSTEFMLTHARYLIQILIHNKLKKIKIISESNINYNTIETDILLFCNNRFLIKKSIF